MLGAQALSRVGGRRMLRVALLFAAAAVVSRARMMLGLSPFALGLFAAGLSTGESAAALLLGCIAGALRIPLSDIDLALPAGCALIMLGALLIDRLPAGRRVPENAAAPVLACVGAFLPGLLKTGLEPYAMALLLLASTVAALGAAAFQALLAWRPMRMRLSADARAPAALLLFAALMGLAQFFEGGAFFAAGLFVVVAADNGSGLGAAMGALTGVALLAGGMDAISAVALASGGAVAGLLANRGRLWAAPGFVLAAGLAGLYAPDAFPGPVAPALAAAAYVAAPEKWLKWLRECVFCADESARAVRDEVSDALRNLAAAFGEMAASAPAADEQQRLFQELREKLCDGCAGYRDCWAGDDDRAVRLLSRAISDAAVFGETRAGEEVPPDVKRVCRRGDRLPALAAEELRALNRRRADDGALSGGMFYQAERILNELAEREQRPAPAWRALNIRWGASATSMSPGTPSGDSHIVRMLPDGRMMLLLSDGMGSGEDARAESERAARLLWRLLAARVDLEAAFQAVNELMLLRSDGDMYATVDLCLVDPVRRRADFLKLAASRSLIARGGEVLTVEGGQLPLGVLEGVAPSAVRVELRPGDVIVMGTDGVMDSGAEGRIEEVLLNHTTLAPGELAGVLVGAVSEDGRRDDRTCVCARITRNRAAREPPGQTGW